MSGLQDWPSGDTREEYLFGKRGKSEEEPVDDASQEEALDEAPEEGTDSVTGPGAFEGGDGLELAEEDIQREEALDDPAQRLAEELEALNDRYLRLAAEFDNYRRRTRREQSELSAVVQSELVRRLLPTLDDLARVAATPTDSATVEALEQGLDLILRNLLKELGDAGLTRTEALGAAFDPQVHQAILTADTEDQELDDTVSRVFVDGYEFQGRLVCPAQVEVLKFEPADEAEE